MLGKGTKGEWLTKGNKAPPRAFKHGDASHVRPRVHASVNRFKASRLRNHTVTFQSLAAT